MLLIMKLPADSALPTVRGLRLAIPVSPSLMTPLRSIVPFFICAALAACAQAPQRAEPTAQAPAAAAPAKTPRVVVAKPEARKAPLPAIDLSEDLLFKMMLAEVAVQRGQPHIAVQTYLELARETQDP